jgi:hypothetical protein
MCYAEQFGAMRLLARGSVLQRLFELNVNHQINPMRIEINVLWSNATQFANAWLASWEPQTHLHRFVVSLHGVKEPQAFDKMAEELANPRDQ